MPDRNNTTNNSRTRRFDQRSSGLAEVGDLSWGSHFCLIHDTEEDLAATVGPYLLAGLEGNEQCLWVTPGSGAAGQPDNAAADLVKALPGLAPYLENGLLEVVPHGSYDASAKGVAGRLEEAVAAGRDGLRIAARAGTQTGGDGVLECFGHESISRLNVIVACIYPRTRLDALGLMSAVKSHGFALLHGTSGWEVIESTEARLARDALKRTEEKLQTLFGNMSEGFAYCRIILDDNGKPCDFVYLEANDAFEKQSGLKLEDVVGKRATKVIPGIEDDPDDLIGTYGRVALSGEPSQFETYVDQLGRWFSVSAFSPHKGFFAATFNDITRRKQAEQALLEREEELASIYENAPLIMLLVNEERRVRKVNRSAEDFTGIAFPELAGRRAGEALGCLNSQDDPHGCGFGPECEACPVRHAIGRIFETGEGSHQIEASRPFMIDGKRQEITFLLSTAPVSVQGEQRALVTIQDISARKRAEDSISRQNQVLEGISQIFRQALVSITDEALASECLSLVQGITGSEFGFIGEIGADGLLHDVAVSDPGREVRAMFDTPDRSGPADDFQDLGPCGRVLLDGEPLIANQPGEHPDSTGTPEGHPRLKSFLGVPLKRGGKTIGLVALANRNGGFREEEKEMVMALAPAIVESLGRKRAEVELKHTLVKLEQSNDELQQFAYVASHDLQEPLRMVASFLQLLWQRYAEDLDDNAREFIDYAVDGANRMQAMINDLLLFSRVGSRDQDFVDVDMQEIFDTVLGNLRVLIRESGAQVSSGRLPAIKADPSLMSLLLQNLVSNGIKFQDGEAPRVRVEAELRDGEWLFSVADNGIGMDPEYSDRIFVIFQRLHGRTEYPGTGIGLAVCKRIVDRHHGRIWVESSPGHGSTFYYSIPAQ